eukprot:c20175_g1_i1.p1 GENE.c20175_g1_i1~~c20175_g1_i1.p1  ORF type:complete len:549 (+),score=178.60 c20175_g1_i1:45-1691(+)
MLVLYETPAGFALFKISKPDKVATEESAAKTFSSVDSAKKAVKLKAFKKFEDTEEALAAARSLIECDSLDKGLKSFLKKECKGMQEELAVSDVKFGGLIKEQLKLPVVHNEAVAEIFRGIREHINELIEGLDEDSVKAMSIGLAHSLARHKLQFSPDKVDTMIIQAIGLLDDLDKELNTYAMQVREWYGWHFPEMSKVIADNMLYAKTILKMGLRSNAPSMDLSDVLPEETEGELKRMAIISMGTEISDNDMENIKLLASQVVDIAEYRAQLFEYLKSRMAAIAPNLTMMVGELVGARLIAHAGSLMNLAKHPASTVQILGAEKALFRALKTKKETPKYGLIYHASLVGQASSKNKGKISRVLAAKTALSIRVDALGDETGASIAFQDRAKVEQRMRFLEGGTLTQLSGKGRSSKTSEKQHTPQRTGAYNPAGDVVEGGEEKPNKKSKDKEGKKSSKEGKKNKGGEDTEMKDDDEHEHENGKEEGSKKKKKDKATKHAEEDGTEKKKKKRAHDEEEEAEESDKKKKKRKAEDSDGEVKEKKKKKKSHE